MALDIILLSLLFVSTCMLWYRISIKIPELIAVPDEVIAARLEEDSAQVRLFFLHFKSFFREKRYKKSVFRACEKILHKVHIIMMRADNAVMSLLKKMRENSNGSMRTHESVKEEVDDRVYWDYLREREDRRPSYASEIPLQQKRVRPKV